MQQLDAESQGTCRSGQLQSPVCGAMDSRWSFYSLAKPLLVLCEAVNVTRNTFSLAFEDLFSPTAHLRYSEISLRMRYRAVTPTALRDALPCFADSDECRNGTKLECSLCFDHGPGFQAPQSTPKPVQRQPGRINHPQRFGYAISKCIMRSSSATTTQTTRSCCLLQQVWCGASLTRTEYLSYRQPLHSAAQWCSSSSHAIRSLTQLLRLNQHRMHDGFAQAATPPAPTSRPHCALQKLSFGNILSFGPLSDGPPPCRQQTLPFQKGPIVHVAVVSAFLCRGVGMHIGDDLAWP